jgi:hypothetical protein
MCGPRYRREYIRIRAMPPIIKLTESKKARKYWSSWIWLKIKSTPMKVGEIGKAINPKVAMRKKSACLGYS